MSETLAQMEPKQDKNPIVVNAQVVENGVSKERTVAIDMSFGGDLSHAITAYGEATVYALFQKAARAEAEAEIRRLLRGRPKGKGLSDAEVKARMKFFLLGVDMEAREKALKAIASIGVPEARQAAMQALGATPAELDLYLEKPTPAAAPKTAPKPDPVKP